MTTGYGRIIRDDSGESQDHRDIDATPEQREIKEVFPATTAFA
jgi:bifunctional N-acetylglucosamine-1-phosphate-uridyltransferase/glucosamine-1-phosphate-acetyltransferase GlmU-like protein